MSYVVTIRSRDWNFLLINAVKYSQDIKPGRTEGPLLAHVTSCLSTPGRHFAVSRAREFSAYHEMVFAKPSKVPDEGKNGTHTIALFSRSLFLSVSHKVSVCFDGA